MKLCIACAEEIKAEALLCKHCGTRQDDKSFNDAPSFAAHEPAFPNGEFEDGNLDLWNSDIEYEGPSDSGATSTCTNCFASIKPEWTYCDQCGTRKHKSQPSLNGVKEPQFQTKPEAVREASPLAQTPREPSFSYYPMKDSKQSIRSRAAIISTAVVTSAIALGIAGFLSTPGDNIAEQGGTGKQQTVAPAAPTKTATPEPTYSDEDLFRLIAEQSTLELRASFSNRQQCGIDCISINGKLTLKPEYALREVLKRSLKLKIDLIPREPGSETFTVPLVSERQEKFDTVPITLNWETYANSKFEATLVGGSDPYALPTSLLSAKTTLYNFACEGLCQESGSDDNPLLPKFGQVATSLRNNGYCDSMSAWNAEYNRGQQNCESDLDGVRVDLLLAETGLELYYQLNEAAILGQGWAFKSRSSQTYSEQLLSDLAAVSPFLVTSRCNVRDVREPFDPRPCLYVQEGAN